jgi:hemerythrin
MALLEWKESYSVRIEELDRQHKGLLELINELSAMNTKTPDNQKLFATLNALVEYAQTHFETEERYLTKYNYPKLVQHQREHVVFTAEVFTLAQKFERNDPNLHNTIVDFTKNWYISHILGTDREYVEFLAAKGAT